jgi:hypothetical protein
MSAVDMVDQVVDQMVDQRGAGKMSVAIRCNVYDTEIREM